MDKRIVEKKLQLLTTMARSKIYQINQWEARLADHYAAGQYRFRGDWQRVELPARFPAGATVFLRAAAEVPARAVVADTYFDFEFQNLEGLLRLKGEPYAGIDGQHPRAPVPGRGRHRLELEFTSVPAAFIGPQPPTVAGILTQAAVVTIDRELEALVTEVGFAHETAQLSADPRRRPLLEAAVEATLLAVDLTLPAAQLRVEAAHARRLLRRQLAAIAPDPEAGRVFAVGHTHIDTAWLWPLRETVRKCGRTFSTACRLMERYPDFHFACSQPQLYQYTQEHFPGLYRQIKKWVKTGRWETTGAMWVECDCNAPSGESLIRQMLHGLDFFRREFGTRPKSCWLPDVFGYPASLPEILAGCGVEYFYTYKLHWQARNPFPDHLFRWRGLDGAEVLAHVVNHVWGYNNYLKPEHLLKGWEIYAQKAEYPEVIFPFGFGDGGGGVTEDQLNQLALAQGQYPGLPAVRTGPAEKYFAEVVKARPDLPVWDGELYVETHRGTYTTQSAVKRANRRCELALREAEIRGSLAAWAGARGAFAAPTLATAWREVLLQQFHDILPGSSIAEVYAETRTALAQVQAQAEEVARERLQALLGGGKKAAKNAARLTVFNSLGWARGDMATAQIPAPSGSMSVVGPAGDARPAQVIERRAGQATILFSAAGVPALGRADFALARSPAPAPQLTVTRTRLENRFFRLAVNAAGGLTSVYDKRHERETLAGGEIGNDLQLFQDGPEREDAWNVHETASKRRYPFSGRTTLQVVETGPVRGVLRVTRTHRQSRFEQDIVIYSDLPRIDFVNRVDWQERHTLLKVAFPLAIRSPRATYEVQFGAYERPTHRNTSWDQQKFEVPAQRWADLSETGYGVSLLNDSRYGYDIREHVMRLTLLRSTIYPDPEADRGRHEFTYALLPHAGGWTEAETVRHAWELNVPATSVLRPAAGEPVAQSYLQLDGIPAVVEALKPAEDGRGFILRVYEPHGGRGRVTLRAALPLKAVGECNLVEEDGRAVPVKANGFEFALRPYQIRTFRLLPQKGG